MAGICPAAAPAQSRQRRARMIQNMQMSWSLAGGVLDCLDHLIVSTLRTNVAQIASGGRELDVTVFHPLRRAPVPIVISVPKCSEILSQTPCLSGFPC